MASLVQKIFTTTCNAELLIAINNDGGIAPELLQIINDMSSPSTTDFWFDSAISPAEEVVLDGILASWVCPTATGDVPDEEVIDDTAPAGPDVIWTSDRIQQEIDNISLTAGPQGPVGPQGPQGIQGPSGPKGDTGDAGPAGAQGLQGDQGIQGIQGPVGPVGPDGPQGLPGTQGIQGPQGLPGADGADGAAGPQGIQGLKGDTGDTGPAGPAGPQGDQGIQGIQGATGAQGPAGPAGPAGATGPQGLKGDTGDTGPTGPQGLPGSDGADGSDGAPGQGFDIEAIFNSEAELLAGSVTEGKFGLVAGTLPTTDPDYGKLYLYSGGSWTFVTDMSVTGADGIQGPVGPQGPQGVKGDTGDTGAQGPQGLPGADGADGVDGAQGPVGPQGPQGLQGDAGPKGDPGDPGADGADGAQGIQGPQGPVGAQGPQGDPGPQGTPGTAGSQGPQGQSAYDVAVTEGFVGDESAWLNSLVGPQGAAGVDGSDGAQGPQGSQGVQGPIGPQGDTGPQGAQGIQGPTGLQGPQGDPGPTGAAGAQGPQGLQGPQGDPGADGADGAQGPQGIQGIQGIQGDAGQGFEIETIFNSEADLLAGSVTEGKFGLVAGTLPTSDPDYGKLYLYSGGSWTFVTDMSVTGADGVQGPQGPQGIQGIQGDPGPQGIQGIQGPAGSDGANGAAGADGADGDSAYQVAVNEGFVGDETAWLASLQGAQGVQGIQGPQGNDGAQGPVGPQGPQGPQGLQGIQGVQGIQGDPGADGANATPAAPDTAIQYNDNDTFGGEAAFTYDKTANRMTILGPADQTNIATLHGGVNTLDTAQRDLATLYIQVDGDATYEGMRTYFKRSSAGISGWITYHYDQATPNIRLTDEDDDAPYISFHTIASGTYDLPEFVSTFGARGATGSRDPGQEQKGFAWNIGSNVDPRDLYSTYNPVMELDEHWLRIPTGTTAERPSPSVNGMVRYNTTTNKLEGYENGGWENLVEGASGGKEAFHAHNGATTQALTTAFVTAIIGTATRSDASFSNTNGEVTVNKTANFRVHYEISGDSTGTRSAMECVLQINGVNVPGTFAYGYHRNATQGENTAGCTTLVTVTSGDVVRVRIREISGGVVTVANACRLTIEEID